MCVLQRQTQDYRRTTRRCAQANRRATSRICSTFADRQCLLWRFGIRHRRRQPWSAVGRFFSGPLPEVPRSDRGPGSGCSAMRRRAHAAMAVQHALQWTVHAASDSPAQAASIEAQFTSPHPDSRLLGPTSRESSGQVVHGNFLVRCLFPQRDQILIGPGVVPGIKLFHAWETDNHRKLM